MFDVSPLVPEARQTVLAAAQVYWQHTRPWFLGLLVHGSALKGGVIPGGSDIELQLFLTEAAFESTGHLPLQVSMALHRTLAQIDPAPFQYIQCYPLATRLLSDESQEQLRPIPGAYHMLAGMLPVPEATSLQIRERGRRFLGSLRPDAFAIASRLLQHGGGHLERTIRALCTDVWPTLYHVVAWQAPNPLEVWALPKEVVIMRLAATEELGQAIRGFYQSVTTYYRGPHRVDEALAVLEQGVIFLQHVHAWYRGLEPKDST
jgi:hypothetical protein